MKTVSTFVLQETLPEEEYPLYPSTETPIPVPRTVLFAHPSMLQTRTRDAILHPVESPPQLLAGTPEEPFFWAYRDFRGEIIVTGSAHKNMEVPQTIVQALHLMEGDRVDLMLQVDDKRLVIYRVNQEQNMESVLSWPDITLQKFKGEYPFRHLPVEDVGLYNLRVATALAPLGYGQNLFLVAPGMSGKTTMLLDLWQAAQLLSKENPRLFVIACVIGERRKDLVLYEELLSGNGKSNRFELYSAPAEIAPKSQYETFIYALRRARRLAGRYDVFVIIDSLTRAVAAHSYGGVADTQGGMISGGIYTESMITVAREVSLTGDFSRSGDTFGYGSLTIASAVLGSNGKGGTALAQFAAETADNIPDAIWTLIQNPTLGFPRIDVTDYATATRRTELFLTPEKLAELQRIRQTIWGTGPNGRPTRKAEEAHAMLLAYVK